MSRPSLASLLVLAFGLAAAPRPRVPAAVVGERPAGARVWLLRVRADWCGTCRSHVEHTHELLAPFGKKVAVTDVVIADQDNQPAAAAALAARDRIAELFRPPAPLPWVVVLDAKTLEVVETLANPSLDGIKNAIARALGSPAGPPRPLRDGLFTEDQWQMIREMRLPSSPPPDPTNRVGDDPNAAALGKALFVDRGLGPSGRVACISCHDPALLFTNGTDTAAQGVGSGNRNVPSLVLASRARWQLWDGRADSLWAQALLPFEDATEFGSSRLFVARRVLDKHRGGYEAVFGPLPPFDDADRDAVTRVFVNGGKAIAAFERSLAVKPNALDRYAAGDTSALSLDQKKGLRAFFDAGCAQCHYGPRLTDDAFHNLRFPTGRRDKQPDRGRADGVPQLLASEFRSDGPLSDAVAAPRRVAAEARAAGAFKTPGLRGVPFTMPYGHGGGFGGLGSVIEAHRVGGLPPGSPFAVSEAEPWAQGFDAGLSPRIQEFLKTLTLEIDDPGLPPRR